MMTRAKLQTHFLSGLAAMLLLAPGISNADPTGDQVLLDVDYGIAQVTDFPVVVGEGVEFSAETDTGTRGGTVNVDIGDGTLVISQSGTSPDILYVKVSDLDWLDENNEELPGTITNVTCTVSGGVSLDEVSWTEDSITVQTALTPMQAFSINCVFLVQHVPVTPDGLIQDLIEQVEALVGNDALKPGNGNALIQKLEGARSNLAVDQTNGACGKMGAFINQVEALINTLNLDLEQGMELIDAAIEVQILIPC